MTALDRILPTPRLIELDDVELAAPPAVVWEVVRHVDLADAKLLRLLFFLRTLPSRLRGQKPEELRFSIDDMVSTPERPGFQVLVDDPPHEVAVGAIGKVWEPDIPFVHVDGPEAYAAFSAPDMAKVAWAVRVQPWGVEGSRVEVEVRVDTSDDAAWRKFQRYFRVIGIGSHFIRRQVLGALAERFGRPDDVEARRRMPGDELLADAAGEATHGITIQAPPEAIWPWLLQMGCGRAGYYSHDVLDNGGRRSARDLHPELGELSVGQVIAATPESDEGFEVLRIEAPHLLVLGGLYDTADKKQLPFASPRPDDHWQVTWAFLLEPLDTTRTRLSVRARAAGSPSQAGRLRWIGPVHGFMESAQLRNLAARVEGRLPRDDWRDVGEGMLGAGVVATALLTPFLRPGRSHWGLTAEEAGRELPGDALVPEPRWSWTHAVEVEAEAAEVWPWVAQIGADRGGFYSYQWLENLVGCELRNAERIHPEWALHEGDELRLHPAMPGLRVVEVDEGRAIVAHGPADAAAVASGKPWSATTWVFVVEPLDAGRCRVISRARYATSDDLATRLGYGPTLLEPIGFAMDRRMLLGIKQRAEERQAARRAS